MHFFVYSTDRSTYILLKFDIMHYYAVEMSILLTSCNTSLRFTEMSIIYGPVVSLIFCIELVCEFYPLGLLFPRSITAASGLLSVCAEPCSSSPVQGDRAELYPTAYSKCC
jgi:hypothetical protein